MSYAKDMPTIEKAVRTDAGLASELRTSVMRLRRRLSTERHPDNELGMPAMAVLGALSTHGEMSLGELATHERVQPPSMTRTVNCLEEGGYVVRRPHESDGRQVVVSLEGKGLATIRADRARRDAWLDRRLRDLSAADRAVLRQAAPILERIARSD
jgi:DNA-binding MarR family transcriptional regulator